MSGAEAIVVLGVISAIISIIDGTKQVYGSAKDARGLPEAFREVAGRLPVVRNILESAKLHLGKGDAGEGSCKGAKHVVEACEIKAKKLDDLFHSAIPADGTLDLKRYYKAVKACGKGNEVEKLMKGMLEDVQLLACECGMSITTKAQEQQIVKAIAEVSAAPPSVPEHVFQESAITNNNYGLGTQHNAQGENIALGSARQYNTAGGAMHFGTH